MSLSATKRALVVGATSGIGEGIALALAKRDYEVVVAGRSEERGKAVVESLQQCSNPQQRQHKFIPIDCFDLASVKQVADAVGETDVLVMTQGMATLQGYTPTTADGLDQKLQLHYFSRVYLTQLMLARHMKPGARVLTVLSAGIHGRYKHYDTDFELKDHYSVKNAADAAGFYQDAAFEKLAELHPQVTFCHAAPGFVNTSWGTEMPALVRGMIRPLQALFATSLESCGETLTAGLLDRIDQPGFYLMNQKGAIIDKSKAIKHTAAERDVIWEKTVALLPDIVN